MRHFRRWGVVYIFFIMWMATGVVHYHYLGEKLKAEAEEQGFIYHEPDRKTEWLSDTFENHQSEYAQLFFQTLLVVGFAKVLFQKETEDRERIERKIDELAERL
jgi:hypothetical protein